MDHPVSISPRQLVLHPPAPAPPHSSHAPTNPSSSSSTTSNHNMKLDRPSSSSSPPVQHHHNQQQGSSSQGTSTTRPGTSAGRLDTTSLSQALPGGSANAHQSSGIRSRITVVCAECKRLKLKCDRRTPCSSCVKRDTIVRCVYTAAATEKIDVQSLHNRLLTVETKVDHLTAHPPTSAASSTHGGPAPSRPSRPPHDPSPPPPPPTALIATGPGGSSIVVSLEDVAGVWLDTLGVPLEVELRIDEPSAHGSAAGGWESLFPPFGLFFPSAESASGLDLERPPRVTRQLLEKLPRGQLGEMVRRQFELVVGMHPGLNVREWERRVRGMWRAVMGAEADVDGEREVQPQQEVDEDVDELDEDQGEDEDDGMDGGQRQAEDDESCTSMTFFALVSASYALGAQSLASLPVPPPTLASPSSPAPSPVPTPSALTSLAHSLLSLSSTSLALAQRTAAYDLDTLLAMRMQVLFKLHEASQRVGQEVGPEVGKMVGVARVMGLHVDPDELRGGQGEWSVWEREMRRRVWWDVYYYDLFISDCMGLPPSIDDTTFSCRLPSDVDDRAFHPGSTSLPLPTERSNFTFFILKCRLAQLVKRIRKAALVPTLNIDAAIALEDEIKAFLSALPPAFQLAADQPIPAPVDDVLSLLVAQRCELAAIAHQLVLKVYHPFLRRGGAGTPAPHQAMHASVQGAHVLIHASDVLRKTLRQVRPATFVFYSFGRQVFHAAVIAAHTVIQAPLSLFAEAAMKDLERALGIMRDPALTTGRGPARGGVEGAPSEAVRVVEMLRAKAELAMRGMGGAAAGAGMKRKHEEVDESLGEGFVVPFVGGAVVTAGGEEHLQPQQAYYPQHQQQQRQEMIMRGRAVENPWPASALPVPLPVDPPRTWVYQHPHPPPALPLPPPPPQPQPTKQPTMPPPASPLTFTHHQPPHPHQHQHHIPDHRPTKERTRTHPQVGFRSRERERTSAGIVSVPPGQGAGGVRKASVQPQPQQQHYQPPPTAPAAMMSTPHNPHPHPHPEYVGTPYGPQEVGPFFHPQHQAQGAYEQPAGEYGGQQMAFDFNAQHQQQQQEQPQQQQQAQAFELSPQVARGMSIPMHALPSPHPHPHAHHPHAHPHSHSIPSTPVDPVRFNPALIPVQQTPKHDAGDLGAGEDQPMLGIAGGGGVGAEQGQQAFQVEGMMPVWDEGEGRYNAWSGFSFG